MPDALTMRAEVARQLQAAEVPSPYADATSIVAHALRLPPVKLATVREISEAQHQHVSEWTARRAAREPLQHILGVAYFRHLVLAVGPGVFIPRPETEVLVDVSLQRAPTGARVVDLCAGSGAVGLAMATEGPALEVIAVENQPPALRWLHRNTRTHAHAVARAGGAFEVIEADATDNPLPGFEGAVDLVATNPPYIPDDATPVDPEVAKYDPPEALYGGPDGLRTVRKLAMVAARLLRSGGWLVVEHGDTQGSDIDGVPAVLAVNGRYTEITDLPDLAGRPRVTAARRV